MSDTPQTKEKKEPTIWHTIGVGITIGILPFVIIIIIVIASQAGPIGFDAKGLPYLFVIVFISSFGAYIGKSIRKTFAALWVGAIISLIVSAILYWFWFMLFVFD